MQTPTKVDYARIYFTLFERFQQERCKSIHYGHPFELADRDLSVFVTVVDVRRLTGCKA